MKKLLSSVLFVMFLLSVPALAETRTVTIPVVFTCPSSEPAAMEMVLSRVAGVLEVEASASEERVRITFDDAITDLDTLLDALDAVGLGSLVGEIPDQGRPATE